MEDIIKIVQSLKDTGLILKGVSEIIENEAKEQKGEICYYFIRYTKYRFISRRRNE